VREAGENASSCFDACEQPLDRLKCRFPGVDTDLFPDALGIIDGVAVFEREQ
jgi:hypothetical protein